MIIEEQHLVKVGTRTINHYRNLGYDCNFRDEILVSTSELSKGSVQIVSVMCDYCGDIYHPTYASYNSNKKKTVIDKDCCRKCQPLKNKDVCKEKYGVDYTFQLEDVQIKRKNTLIDKYGVDNIAKLPETIDKMKATCIERYGEDNYRKTDVCKEQVKNTCLEKYGVDNPSKVEEFKQKKIETSLSHYGTEYPVQNEDVKIKCLTNRNISLSKNGNIPTSSQQIEVFNTLKDYGYNVELNYPESKFTLDVALFKDDIKIDVEYDGWFWHQDSQRDNIRNNILINKFGWKVLRIKGSYLLPTNKQLIDAIESLLNTNSVLTEIVLDDWR